MKKNPLNWALHWQIFLALLLALIIGLGLKPLGADSDLTASILGTCSFIGSLFMNALKMVIVPLIVASIICGVMHLGKEQGVGRIGFKTLLYYTLSGAVAVLIGLLVVNVIGPGNVDPETAAAMLGQGADATAAAGLDQRVAGRDGSDLAEIFLRMFPPNIVDAATSNGQLLGVIVFSLLFGLFIGRLTEDLRATQASFWEGVQSVMLMLTEGGGHLTWAALPQHGPCALDGLLDLKLFGNAAADDGDRAAKSRCQQKAVRLHAASGRDRQHGWDSAL